jgi:hypothetical protein
MYISADHAMISNWWYMITITIGEKLGSITNCNCDYQELRFKTPDWSDNRLLMMAWSAEKYIESVDCFIYDTWPNEYLRRTYLNDFI